MRHGRRSVCSFSKGEQVKELRELLLKNRSYRGYDENVTLTRKDLEELVELVRLSASAGNRQPLKYYLAWEKEAVEEILSITQFAPSLRAGLPHEGKHPTAFIVICQDMQISANTSSTFFEVGIAAQTILLGAAERGLGGLMIGLFNREKIIGIMGTPASVEPRLVIALGKPDEEIRLVDATADNLPFYRDESDVHYVPKRKLEDLILNA
ncbi:MAG: nitroreductase family protein [Clostridia bacterium]|nr:nitroreductase family protein [Clostridia bacterium]